MVRTGKGADGTRGGEGTSPRTNSTAAWFALSTTLLTSKGLLGLWLAVLKRAHSIPSGELPLYLKEEGSRQLRGLEGELLASMFGLLMTQGLWPMAWP